MIPTLNPVGHQSTNWMDRFVLTEAMAALTSLGTTSPRYSRQTACKIIFTKSRNNGKYHVFAASRITFHHLISRFEAHLSDVIDTQRFVIGFVCRDDRSVSSQREVDSRIRNEVCLEFSQVDIEGSVETKGSRDRRNDLGN